MNNKKEKYTKRSPIITIAGHVDHGKTTFLNYLRKVKKPAKEHGDITQYVKPYSVKTKYGSMTFLDTPGHFTFNSLRKKSIEYSDIMILLIAADDGIQPQTIESVKIANKFNISVIVAINKIDKSKDNINKILSNLTNYDLTPEEWGGDTLVSLISSKTGEGIDDLISKIHLQSDLLDLKSRITGLAEGIVIDNKIDIGKGAITTIFVLNGILKKNDTIKINNNYGKIKTITDSKEKNLTEAHPSIPVKITGISGLINIGEKFKVIKDTKHIKKIKTYRTLDIKNTEKIYNVKDFSKLIENKNKIIKINLIIKADMQGSLNTLEDTIKKLSKNDINIILIKSEIGNINSSDIDLAVIVNAFIIGFNVKCDSKAKKKIHDHKVNVKIFNVIYTLIDYIKIIIKQKISKKITKQMLGIAKVKKIFQHKKTNAIIAGCLVTFGKINQKTNIKIYRKDIMIYQGAIESMKILKKKITEVHNGNECGISIKNFNDIKIDDEIKSYF